MTTQARLFAYLGASIVAVLIVSGAAAAQESSAARAGSSAQPDRGAAPGNDIKVHGHWTIDLRNPDGSLASHNEFENACVECGQVIGLILSRQAGVNLWQVRLLGISPVCEYGGFPAYCSVAEVGAQVTPDIQGYFFPTLTLTTSGATFTLHGNLVATFDGDISEALSSAHLSTAVGTLQFSQRTLGTPIPVAAGQTVYVTVTFSFS